MFILFAIAMVNLLYCFDNLAYRVEIVVKDFIYGFHYCFQGCEVWHRQVFNFDAVLDTASFFNTLIRRYR